MKSFLRNQLERSVQRLEDLEHLLQQADVVANTVELTRLSKEHSSLSQTALRYKRYRDCEGELADAHAMLGQAAENDAEIAAMAADEVAARQAELLSLEAELQRLMLPPEPDEVRNAFLEIRAGTGGDESALFAGDLLRMYTRYAQAEGLRVEVISESPAELGGYKEVVLRVVGDHAYGRLRFESGGHRVQRIPVTESQGRIHTSACTVAVFPEPDEAQAVQINPADLRIDTFRSSGAGGQHVNKTDSAVRITHLPTGLVAECQDDRSQHRNKARALQVLLARLQERERQEQEAAQAAARKDVMATGDRSDRIRTYNYPQGRVTDHRVNLTLYKLPMVMDGDLGEFITALIQANEARRLAAWEAEMS